MNLTDRQIERIREVSHLALEDWERELSALPEYPATKPLRGSGGDVYDPIPEGATMWGGWEIVIFRELEDGTAIIGEADSATGWVARVDREEIYHHGD